MKSEVFSINFIRQGLIPLPVRRLILYGVLGYFGINLLVTAGLLSAGFSASFGQFLLKTKIKKELTSPHLNEFEDERLQLKQDLAGRSRQLKSIVQIEEVRFMAGEKLAGLAETLPVRTWMIRVSRDPGARALKIQSNYFLDPEKPAELPVKEWAEALKSNPHFNQNLKRLDMTTSSRTNQGKAKLFTFELEAEWNKP